MKRPLTAMALCVILAASPASAQLALPGAVAPGPGGTAEKAARPKKAPKAAAKYTPPGVETLAGRALLLNGAVLAPPQLRACVCQQAHCQASPSGLWGPAGSALEAQARQIEQARARVEAAMTANYRALNARLNDPAKADELARGQSRFSSDRQDT